MLFQKSLMRYLVLSSCILFSHQAFAKGKKVCEIEYDRTACPGQEETSYKKCGGKKTCVKKHKAKNAEQCQKKAMKSCENSRLDITKSKIIKAKFDGEVLKTKDGNDNFCAPDREDFNKCGQ